MVWNHEQVFQLVFLSMAVMAIVVICFHWARAALLVLVGGMSVCLTLVLVVYDPIQTVWLFSFSSR